MFFTRRQHQQPPQYAQYHGDQWVPGQPVVMPARQWRTAEVPWQLPGLAGAPARQAYQAPVTGLVAPVVPPSAPTSTATQTPWQPAAQANIQRYYFLRAPTGLEAIVGPQYNPVSLLGLE